MEKLELVTEEISSIKEISSVVIGSISSTEEISSIKEISSVVIGSKGEPKK